jgi:hypothetical protein
MRCEKQSHSFSFADCHYNFYVIVLSFIDYPYGGKLHYRHSVCAISSSLESELLAICVSAAPNSCNIDASVMIPNMAY